MERKGVYYLGVNNGTKNKTAMLRLQGVSSSFIDLIEISWRGVVDRYGEYGQDYVAFSLAMGGNNRLNIGIKIADSGYLDIVEADLAPETSGKYVTTFIGAT